MKKTLLFLICLLMFPGFIYAQVSTAEINGKVFDNNKNEVFSANVLLEDIETGITKGTTTNEKGLFHFFGLPPGKYKLTIQHVSFGKQSQSFSLIVGQKAQADFTLYPKDHELSEVEIVSTMPKFELNKSDVSTAVKNEQIEALPLDSRNILNLGAITPGVKSFGGSFPLSGAISSYNFINLYVNGSEWKSQFNGNIVGLGQTASPLPQGAIQEFRVVLNAYDAEYTRGASYLVSAVTKRGTNLFKGSFFSNFQNKDLTNRGPFQSEKPNYNRQQLGASLSGPIIRDKLFFAATYELNNATNYSTVNPGKPAYSPNLWSRYAGEFESPSTTHLGALKITYQADEKNMFNLAWNSRYTSSKFYFGGTVAYDAGIFGEYYVNDVMLQHTHTLNNNAVNELTLQYLAWRHDEPTIKSGPSYIYPSISLGRATFPIKLEEDHFTLVEKLTYSLGDHVIKAGGKVTNLNAAPWFPYYKDGEFQFATDTSSLPYRATIGIGMKDPNSTEDAKGESSGWALGAFIQDRWQVHDRLILNLGVRWDGEINMLNNDYRVRWLDDPVIRENISADYLNNADRKNSLDNVAPRFSFNFDVFNNRLTMLRGGYGIFYDRTVGYIGYFEYLYSNWGMYTFENPGTTDVNVLRNRALSGEGSASPSIYLINKEIDMPKINQWSIGVGHQFTENFAVGIDYVNKHVTDIFKAYNANYYKPSLGKRVLTDNYADIWLYDSFGEAKWYGILTNITYQDEKFLANLAYTLSWSYTLNDGNTYNLKELFYWKRSNFDERHRAALNFALNFPFEIQLSGIFTIATPTPYSAYVGQDINDDGSNSDDFINGVPNMISDANKIRNWYKMLDMRISKFFKYQNYKFGLYVEAYNLGNWFNASGYYGRYADAEGNPYSNFGQPTGAYLPRTLQLGLKVFYN